MIYIIFLYLLTPNYARAAVDIIQPKPVTNIRSGLRLIPDCISDKDKVSSVGGSCISESIAFYLGLMFFVLGVAAFGYLIYGGFLMMTAYGDTNKIEQAKRTITYAIIGMIIAILAATIINVLVNNIILGS